MRIFLLVLTYAAVIAAIDSHTNKSLSPDSSAHFGRVAPSVGSLKRTCHPVSHSVNLRVRNRLLLEENDS